MIDHLNREQQMQYPFVLLSPLLLPPREDSLSILGPISDPDRELSFIFEGRALNEPLALDLETQGSDVMNLLNKVVGVGLSDSRGSLYLDLQESPEVWPWLLKKLVETQVPLLMHNAYFDLAFIRRDLLELGIDTWPNLHYCTYALFRLISTEDWPGFSWSLKAAQLQLLGWSETNEGALDQWLVDNGYIANIKIPRNGGSPPSGYYLNKEGTRWCSPKKGEMWRAPKNILGYYCCLDADSTWLLFTYILKPVLDRFKGLAFYASSEIYGEYIKLMIEQRRFGVSLNEPDLDLHHKVLKEAYEQSVLDLFQNENIKAYAEEQRIVKIENLSAKEPEQFKKFSLGIEPVKYTKDGRVSRSWEAWNKKREAGPQISKQWINWTQKMEELQQTSMEELFNINSGPQRVDFFYRYMGYPVLVKTKKDTPATNKDALKGWGEIGKLLQVQNKIIKETQYVEATLSQYIKETETIHPGFKVPGTSSGRLAGVGGYNFQQQPKSFGLLNSFRAREGNVLVEMDFTALESVIIAELSRDKNMLRLYGPDANPHQDIHLFTGSFFPGIGQKIKAAGYDPENPTQEGVERAKKECKKERDIAKTVVYASAYQAGPGKIAQTLTLNGVPTSLEEGKRLHASYWETYRGVREFNQELERQWRLNDGWILNGIGRPVCLIEDKRKDLLSKCVQSTGHDCLVLLLVIYHQMLREVGIAARQWGEFHDALIIEVDEKDGERARSLLQNKALPELNRQLGGLIPLRGEAQLVKTLAQAKGLKGTK